MVRCNSASDISSADQLLSQRIERDFLFCHAGIVLGRAWRQGDGPEKEFLHRITVMRGSLDELMPILAVLEIATGLGIAIFWLLLFTVGIAPAHPPAAYFAFEHIRSL